MSLRMTNGELKQRLGERRAELRERVARIGVDLRRESDPASPDAPDRAVQRENDEVLLALADAAETEISAIDATLLTLDATGAVACRKCGKPIEPARLSVVPEASRCEQCIEDAAADPDLEDAFRECDRDGDGAILFMEFSALLIRCGSTLGAERQRTEFDGIDRNGDGRVDWNEFKQWWRAR
jgi:RNA polymerase-binding transcription factor DksA